MKRRGLLRSSMRPSSRAARFASMRRARVKAADPADRAAVAIVVRAAAVVAVVVAAKAAASEEVAVEVVAAAVAGKILKNSRAGFSGPPVSFRGLTER